MVRLNDFQRGVIVSLHKLGMKTGEILVRLRQRHQIEVSERTVRKALADKRVRGGRPKREHRGRKRKCSGAQERAIVREAERNRWLSLLALTERVNNLLRGEGVRVSFETVRKTLLEHGLRRRRALRQPLLTQVQRQRRLDFAQHHAH
jgi:transposase